MTNFNSIVNQNITINKLFFEVCIPKIFVNTNILGLNAIKVKEYIKHKDIYNQLNDIKMDKFTSNLNSNNKPQNTQSTSTSSAAKTNLASVSQKKEAPIKIPQLFQSDFNTVRKAVFNTPLHNQMDNNFLLENNSYLSQPAYFSPKSFHNQSLNKMNNSISGIYPSNSFSVYVSPNFSQHIPSSPNLSYINNNRNYFMPPPLYSFNQNSDYDLFSRGGFQRRMSENNIDNKDNNSISSYSSRSNYMGYSNLNNSFIQNHNLSLLSLSKPSIFGDEYSRYSGFVNNGYVSPRSVRNFQLINEIGLRKFGFESANKSVTNFSNKSTIGMVPHISSINQKISNYNTDDEQDLNDDIIPIERNLNTKIDAYLSSFLKLNEGSCNLLIFIKTVTPYIYKNDVDNYVYYLYNIIFRSLLL